MSGTPRNTRKPAAAVPAAASEGTLEVILREILRAAVRQVNARSGALGLLSADGRRTDRFAVEGPDDEAREHPDGHPARAALDVPICGDAAVLGNLSLTGKRSGGAFTESDIEVTQSLAAVAGLAIENIRLLERAERRRTWAQAGTDISTTLLGGADPDEVLRAAAEQVAELSQAQAGGVLVPVPGDGRALRVVAAVGPKGADAEGVLVPMTDPLLREAQRSGIPRLVTDIEFQRLAGSAPALAEEFSHEYGPAMLIPLGGPPALGTLVVMRRRGRDPFEPELLELAAAFAAQATVALELVRSQQRERRLQVQADRDRIARDLHDHVVQRIFATALALDRISRSLEDETPELAARLAERVDELDGTISRIRTSIFELQHQDASPEGVRHRLAEVVRSVVDGHGLRPALRVHGEVEDLPAELVPDVVATVRELVTNVVRHAGADRVTVTVTVTDALRVQVTDDGCGLPEITVRSGLANLEDRAERRGGRLTAHGSASGSEVEWTVPLAR